MIKKKKFNELKVVFLGNPEIGHEVFFNLIKIKKIKILAFLLMKYQKN